MLAEREAAAVSAGVLDAGRVADVTEAMDTGELRRQVSDFASSKSADSCSLDFDAPLSIFPLIHFLALNGLPRTLLRCHGYRK